MVNYFLVGLANRRAEITRRGTKRPLRCIGQRESRYAEGKDRENWTCSRLIFFSFFFTGISSRSQLTCRRHDRAPFSWISIQYPLRQFISAAIETENLPHYGNIE